MIKWVVVSDFRLFTTPPGGRLQGYRYDAVAGSSGGTDTVVRAAAADAVAGMSTGPAVKASASGGTDR